MKKDWVERTEETTVGAGDRCGDDRKYSGSVSAAGSGTGNRRYLDGRWFNGRIRK